MQHLENDGPNRRLEMEDQIVRLHIWTFYFIQQRSHTKQCVLVRNRQEKNKMKYLYAKGSNDETAIKSNDSVSTNSAQQISSRFSAVISGR